MSTSNQALNDNILSPDLIQQFFNALASESSSIASGGQEVIPEFNFDMGDVLDAIQSQGLTVTVDQSPAPHLPDPILSEIFLYTISSEPPTQIRTLDASSVLTSHGIARYTPWVARQVCRQWMNVVARTRQLWQDILIVLGHQYIEGFIEQNSSSSRLEDFAQIIKRHLALVKRMLPINATEYVGIHVWFPVISMTQPVFRNRADAVLVKLLIPSYSNRLRTLTLRLGYEGAMAFSMLQYETLRSTESLYLELVTRTPLNEFMANVKRSGIFRRATYLRNFGFRGNGKFLTDAFFYWCGVPWVQLQRLTITYDLADASSLKSLLHILKRSLCITYLKVGFWAYPSMWLMLESLETLSEDNTVVLTALSHLVLDTDISLLHHLVAPSLKNLELPSSCVYARTHVIPSINRSKCKLVVFNDHSGLGSYDFPVYNGDQNLTLKNLAEPLDCVRELRLSYPIGEEDILDVIQGKIFPELRLFHCMAPLVLPLSLISAVEEAIQVEEVYTRRHIRVFAETLEPVSDDDMSAFRERAERLLRRTLIELEYIHSHLALDNISTESVLDDIYSIEPS